MNRQAVPQCGATTPRAGGVSQTAMCAEFPGSSPETGVTLTTVAQGSAGDFSMVNPKNNTAGIRLSWASTATGFCPVSFEEIDNKTVEIMNFDEIVPSSVTKSHARAA